MKEPAVKESPKEPSDPVKAEPVDIEEKDATTPADGEAANTETEGEKGEVETKTGPVETVKEEPADA